MTRSLGHWDLTDDEMKEIAEILISTDGWSWAGRYTIEAYDDHISARPVMTQSAAGASDLGAVIKRVLELESDNEIIFY